MIQEKHHTREHSDALRYVAKMLGAQCGEQMRQAGSELSAEEIASVFYDRLCLEIARERQ